MAGLLLQASTADWLVSCGSLDRGSLRQLNGAAKGGSVVLDEAATARFEAGAVRLLALVDFLPTRNRRLHAAASRAAHAQLSPASRPGS